MVLHDSKGVDDLVKLLLFVGIILLLDLSRQDKELFVLNNDFADVVFVSSFSFGQVIEHVASGVFDRILDQGDVENAIAIDFGSNDSSRHFFGSSKLEKKMF